MFRSSLILAIFLACSAAQASPPPSIPDPAHERLRHLMAETPQMTMPANRADLDRWLATRDYKSLQASLAGVRDASAIGLDLNWERARLYDGQGLLLALAYAHDLWRLGVATPGQAGDELKQTAAAFTLYGVELIILDGPSCADESAPGHHLDQIAFGFAPILRYAGGLPPADRARIVQVAVAVEQGTASVRGPDDVLCGGGMAEIKAGLAAQGNKPMPQVPNAPGTFGKTYVVPTAPGYKTEFRDPSVWEPKQAEARAQMSANLIQLLDKAAPSPTSPAPPKAGTP